VGAPVGGAPNRRTSTSTGSWDIQARPDSSKLVGPRSEPVVPREADATQMQMPRGCQADAQADAEATSSQTRRCQVAEEMRGPPSGRAQEGRRQPFDEVSGSHGGLRLSSGDRSSTSIFGI
jgi:hypothetical protein